ncbi:transmembrane and death domain protein 1 [Aulostomus maculatus]
MLTSQECQDLLLALSHPEESIFQRLERLSPERNRLNLKPRAKRSTSSAADSEAWCRTALTDWLVKYGEQTYYDRLTRALQHIDRTDIAIEVGKNINQDKALNLKRYVEDYHKYVQTLNVPPLQPDTRDHQRTEQKVVRKRAADLTWRDMDLIVERSPVPLYQKGLSDVTLPLLYGILAGFGGILLAGIFILFTITYIFRRNKSEFSGAFLRVSPPQGCRSAGGSSQLRPCTFPVNCMDHFRMTAKSADFLQRYSGGRPLIIGSLRVWSLLFICANRNIKHLSG